MALANIAEGSTVEFKGMKGNNGTMSENKLVKIIVLIKGVNVVNKKILLCICLLLSVFLLITSCNSKEKKGSDQIVLTQSSIENNIESSSYESEANSENDVLMIETDKEDFYKRLILRLIRNEIAITDGEDKYYFSDTVSVDYVEMLPDSKFYIVDINGDQKLDIGIDFPTNVLVTYYYNEKTDTLSPALDQHIYTEILGNGQILMSSHTAMRMTYFYNVIDIFGEDITMIAFTEDYMGDTILSDGTKKPNYLYSVRVRMHLPDGTRNSDYTSSTTDVTKEQWDMMRKPFEDLRENAPKPFAYEELIAVES